MTGESGGVLSRKVTLEDLDVFALEGRLMVVVGHEAAGLQAVDEGVLGWELPVEGLRVGIVVPPSVEPDGSDRAVVGEELGELRVHKAVIALPVGLMGGAARPESGATQGIVGAIPVQMRVVEMQPDAVVGAGLGELADDVAPEGCGFYYVIRTGCRIEQRESVVMTGGDGDVSGSCGLDGCHPLVGIEVGGVEGLRELGVFVAVDVAIGHDPFAGSYHGVEPPMEKDAEFGVLKFGACGQVVGSGHIACLLRAGLARGVAQAEEGQRE